MSNTNGLPHVSRELEDIVMLKHHAISFMALSGMFSPIALKGTIAEIEKSMTSANSDEENTFLKAAIDLLKSNLADFECEARETAEYRSVIKDWTEIDTSNEDAVSIGVGIAYDLE